MDTGQQLPGCVKVAVPAVAEFTESQCHLEPKQCLSCQLQAADHGDHTHQNSYQPIFKGMMPAPVITTIVQHHHV
jgi:hypothetical protein